MSGLFLKGTRVQDAIPSNKKLIKKISLARNTETQKQEAARTATRAKP